MFAEYLPCLSLVCRRNCTRHWLGRHWFFLTKRAMCWHFSEKFTYEWLTCLSLYINTLSLKCLQYNAFMCKKKLQVVFTLCVAFQSLDCWIYLFRPRLILRPSLLSACIAECVCVFEREHKRELKELWYLIHHMCQTEIRGLLDPCRGVCLCMCELCVCVCVCDLPCPSTPTHSH